MSEIKLSEIAHYFGIRFLYTVGEQKDSTVALLMNSHLPSNFRRLCKIQTCNQYKLFFSVRLDNYLSNWPCTMAWILQKMVITFSYFKLKWRFKVSKTFIFNEIKDILQVEDSKHKVHFFKKGAKNCPLHEIVRKFANTFTK